jgi:hypothetical protein
MSASRAASETLTLFTSLRRRIRTASSPSTPTAWNLVRSLLSAASYSRIGQFGVVIDRYVVGEFEWVEVEGREESAVGSMTVDVR